jgi:23S rRNA-/tRNA-specific pseudouridylate synthase
VIEINFKTEKLDLKAEKIPLDIIYEDKNFAIINKDA